jgi:hypothetical protein
MSRFCIVLAEQPHRLVFAEVVEALSWGLAELGHQVEQSTMPRVGVRNIVLAPHLLLACDECITLEPGTIVYNGEPHVSPLFLRSLRLLAHRNVTAWDYSARNVGFLRELGVPARHVPYAWCPSMSSRVFRVQAREIAREIDILFVGSLSPRRVRVLEQLARKHPDLKVQSLFGAYGVERDRRLLQSRVCLNVHYWDEQPPNEDLRILVACAKAVAVVSEGTPDEPEKRDWAKWCAYDHLVDVVAEHVRSGEWKEQASRGFTAVQMRDAAIVVKQALEGGTQ